MLGAITAFFTALPALVDLIKQVSALLNRVGGPQGISKLAGALGTLNTAKTPEDYQNAASQIQDALTGK